MVYLVDAKQSIGMHLIIHASASIQRVEKNTTKHTGAVGRNLAHTTTIGVDDCLTAYSGSAAQLA